MLAPQKPPSPGSDQNWEPIQSFGQPHGMSTGLNVRVRGSKIRRVATSGRMGVEECRQMSARLFPTPSFQLLFVSWKPLKLWTSNIQQDCQPQCGGGEAESLLSERLDLSG